jgi:hypothetical protein
LNYQTIKIEAHLSHVSNSTIYRTLRALGLVHRICVKRPKLIPTVAKLRLQFSRKYRNFNWKRYTVKFSDECSVEVGSGADREWCFRFASEKYDPEMVQEKEKSKRPSQMVWACFWVTRNGRVGRSKLVIMRRDPTSLRGGYSASSYLETLEEGLLLHYKPGDIFMQDNAPIHTANVTKRFFEDHGVWVLDWPPFSPDINPIEHLWYALKKQLYKDYPHLRQIDGTQGSWDEFCEALQTCWQRLPNSLLRRLIESMPNRLAAVRAAKGWQTKY